MTLVFFQTFAVILLVASLIRVEMTSSDPLEEADSIFEDVTIATLDTFLGTNVLI